MFLWQYQLPAADRGFSFEPASVCSSGYGAIFIHGNPYQNAALSWDFASARYGFGRLGILASYRIYALDDLYGDATYSLGVASKMVNKTYLHISGRYSRESFEGVGNFSGVDCEIRASYHRDNFIGLVGFDGLNLNKPYENAALDQANPSATLIYSHPGSYVLAAGFKRSGAAWNRWYFDHRIQLAPSLDMRLGYITNPNVVEWGLDLTHKSFRLIFTYLGVSRLNDTILFGISVGR